MSTPQLIEIFEEFGRVVDAFIMLDSAGRSKGCGVVEFSEPAAAARAIEIWQQRRHPRWSKLIVERARARFADAASEALVRRARGGEARVAAAEARAAAAETRARAASVELTEFTDVASEAIVRAEAAEARAVAAEALVALTEARARTAEARAVTALTRARTAET